MKAIESQTTSHLLDQNTLAEFIRHAGEIEHPREMIIDVLRAIQLHHGWVPDEGVELTASILGLTPVEVEEIATFYDKIFRRPVGSFNHPSVAFCLLLSQGRKEDCCLSAEGPEH